MLSFFSNFEEVFAFKSELTVILHVKRHYINLTFLTQKSIQSEMFWQSKKPTFRFILSSQGRSRNLNFKNKLWREFR